MPLGAVWCSMQSPALMQGQEMHPAAGSTGGISKKVSAKANLAICGQVLDVPAWVVHALSVTLTYRYKMNFSCCENIASYLVFAGPIT